MHQGVRGNRLFAGPGNIREPIKYSLERHPQLHFSNAGAQAFVHAMAEGDVLIHIVSMQVEVVRVGKDVRVAVGGAIPQHHFFHPWQCADY